MPDLPRVFLREIAASKAQIVVVACRDQRIRDDMVYKLWQDLKSIAIFDIRANTIRCIDGRRFIFLMESDLKDKTRGLGQFDLYYRD